MYLQQPANESIQSAKQQIQLLLSPRGVFAKVQHSTVRRTIALVVRRNTNRITNNTFQTKFLESGGLSKLL